ncbi:MAG: GbsR/MarR family transcriptional regulator [Planctomycetota bacterium]|nr:MAG: GbsR/MarR family transcriptional regulator [Planctomycetota bacterium]
MTTLSPLRQRFILHWGEMGSRWGINRSMAQIHALLLTSEQPLSAEDIVDTLGIARSNISTSLRELQGWGIVRVQHQVGDRRDYFITETDPWTLFRTIARIRLQREVSPTLELLREANAQDSAPEDRYTVERMQALAEFFEMAMSWFHTIDALPTPLLKAFLEAGPSINRWMGGGQPPSAASPS